MAYWLYEKVALDVIGDGRVSSEVGGERSRDEGREGRGRQRSRERKDEAGKFGKAEVLRTGNDRNNFAILL